MQKKFPLCLRAFAIPVFYIPLIQTTRLLRARIQAVVDIQKIRDLHHVGARLRKTDHLDKQIRVAAGQALPGLGVARAAVVGRQRSQRIAIEETPLP